ncbi:MAG TPA: CoA-binding protein [Streptosporangiaceae bacterium]|nr:CoA-binding protein [Streptosporangiaceae bacterium]
MTVSDDQLRDILVTSRHIAVVGLSPNPARPSHRVAAYLQDVGYRIIPVRPAVRSVLGQPAFPDLRSAARTAPIDIVDVFRRSEVIPELVDDCLAVRPRLVFLQVGVVHPGAAARLEAAGIPVVMDECLKVEHARLVGRAAVRPTGGP